MRSDSRDAGYRPRLIDRGISELLAAVPAVMLVGPRAVGKTTTALRHARTVVRLDREAEAIPMRADPDAALRGLPEPILIDEWQVVPEVLGAVKRSVDVDARPGRFIITGSIRADSSSRNWPGTGRLVRLMLYGLTVRERLGRSLGDLFLERLAAGRDVAPANDTPDLRGYVELALQGGFPELALVVPQSARRAWLESYVEYVLTRDVEDLGVHRDPGRLRRYLEAYAINTAGVVDEATLCQAAGISRPTAMAYERLLRDLVITEPIAAWTSNRLKRLVLAPKRFVVDPAIASAVLGVGVEDVMRDGFILGRIIESFVVSQLRPELAMAGSRPRLFHVRQQQGRLEIDLLAEVGARRVIAIEVKADAAPRADAARHIFRLRDEVGDAFVQGVVLHTGPRVYRLGERVIAAPISSIWAAD